MPNRQFSSASQYRYGFNGKENDNETVGTGSGTQDYGMRIYNPGLGKFLSVDPLTNKFPWWSLFAFAGNSPMENIDLDGLEILNYRTPYRLRIGEAGLNNSFSTEIAYSYSDDLKESTQMLATATLISYGLAGKDYNPSMPFIIPLKPGTGKDQELYVANNYEQQQLEFFSNSYEAGAGDASSDATDGSAAGRTKGQRYIRSNNNKTINDRAGAGTSVVEWFGKWLFKGSNTMKSVEAKADLNNIIMAYADAQNIVETYYDFSKLTDMTQKQILQYKIDIINYVADGKLPNGQSKEYGRAVESSGQRIINDVKEANAKKELYSH